MNLEDLTPARGGSLSGPVGIAREPVATFTPTSTLHPDKIWSPRGSELGPPQRPVRQAQAIYNVALSERPMASKTMGAVAMLQR